MADLARDAVGLGAILLVLWLGAMRERAKWREERPDLIVRSWFRRAPPERVYEVWDREEPRLTIWLPQERRTRRMPEEDQPAPQARYSDRR